MGNDAYTCMERDKQQLPPRSHEELLHRLRERGLVRSQAVWEAMLAVDRGGYAPSLPYVDAPQVIGHGATISAPHMHAHSLELLAGHLKPGACALDVGCGSGFLCACMARMVGRDGHVIAIERLSPLVDLAAANVAKTDSDLLDGRLLIMQGDGWKGSANHAPFDAIHVGAAAATVPVALQEQLRPGGRMVIPVGTQAQEFIQIDKELDGSLTKRVLMSVRYVPLVKPEGLQEALSVPGRPVELSSPTQGDAAAPAFAAVSPDRQQQQPQQQQLQEQVMQPNGLVGGDAHIPTDAG